MIALLITETISNPAIGKSKFNLKRVILDTIHLHLLL